VRQQTDDLTEYDSHDKKDNNDDDDDDDDGDDNDDDDDDHHHNNSFQFINLQAILTSAYYKASTKTQNTKTVQIHKNKAQKTRQK
jgi:hypothetical protein